MGHLAQVGVAFQKHKSHKVTNSAHQFCQLPLTPHPNILLSCYTVSLDMANALQEMDLVYSTTPGHF